MEQRLKYPDIEKILPKQVGYFMGQELTENNLRKSRIRSQCNITV
jgi:hypothetical protein